MASTIEIGKRIKEARELRRLTQEQLGNALGMNKSTIQRYETGQISKIKIPVLESIAKELNVDPNWLALKSDTMVEKRTLPPNIISLNSVTYIPLIGTIACGIPILAEQNIERKILLPDMVKADFALRCKGSSMINAGIDDGDVVFIRHQSMVENGEIAAVQITDFDTEATLKKVYITNTSITLVAQNPEFEPITFIGENMNRVQIIGKCVAVLKDLDE